MFEEKKYSWLLGELSKIKAKLKILDVAFIKSDQVNSHFSTNGEGIIISPHKNLTTKDLLKKFITRRINGLEAPETLKPIAYAVYTLSKRILYTNEVQELIRKDSKFHNLKELYLMQEYYHNFTTYYSAELIYDGEGLVSNVSRRDLINSDSVCNDSKYLYMTMNLSKYLVKVIENNLDKNVIRLRYDFVVDGHFSLILLAVSLIKVVHPKVISIYKGLNAEQLENLTLVKSEYKNVLFHKVDMIVKEPEADQIFPAESTKTVANSIFMSFVSNFLAGDAKKLLRRKTLKQTTGESEQLSPVPENKIKENPNSSPRIDAFTPDLRILSSLSPSSQPVSKSSPRVTRIPGKRALFPNLQPSSSLSYFLKSEEERILENQSRKVKGICLPDILPRIEKKRAKKLSKRPKKKKSTNSIGRLKVISPYGMS